MNEKRKTVRVIIAEDDDDDYLLASRALEAANFSSEVCRVKGGEELMDYLLHRGDYQDANYYPRPCLILLDLNMPNKDGRETLMEIKGHETLRKIPVVVLTTSKSDKDIMQSYELGVNSFIRKPVKFDELVEIMKALKYYWFEIVSLPENL